MQVDDPGGYTGTFGIVVLIAAVVAVFGRKDIVQTLERATGWDIDGDGYSGDPPPPTEVILTLTREGFPGQWDRFHMKPELYAKLPGVCQSILDGVSFSEAAMTSGKLLTKGEFHVLREIFFKGEAPLIEWRDPQYHTQGVKFTPYGRSFLRQMAAKAYKIHPPATTTLRTRTPGVLDVPSQPLLEEGKKERET
jgi:hypothetical protein